MKQRLRRGKDGLTFLLIAAALTVGLWFVPYAEVVVYPFRIFVTFIHETAHALAALMTGGHVEHIEVAPDGNGLTYTRGGWGLLIASAGYLGTVLYGGWLLVIGKQARYVKPALAGTTALITVVTLLLVRPILSFGFLAGVAMTVALAAVLYFFTARLVHFFISFLGVESCLNAMFDLKMLFLLSARTDAPTDAMNLERATLIPAIVWALLWVAISFVILFFALRSYRTALR
ncbi:MAG: M50 family metallopeptidase [Acidobacteria bacterium]|nr:M50 family metallopeptidase [Acidobacteriota bacterium]